MAKTLGIVFSNLHDKNVPDLTRQRTMASVPFGCRYRLIDFTLSNMVNSGISNVGIITHYNYQSLLDHISSGKDWDLARRSGGLTILPPFVSAFSGSLSTLYSSRLEALKGIENFIANRSEEYVVLTDCDVICTIDFRDIIDAHIESDADITIATKTVELNEKQACANVIIECDKKGRVVDICDGNKDLAGQRDINLNIMVMRLKFLQSLITDSIAHNWDSFHNDIIRKNLSRLNIRAYKYDALFANITSISDYFDCNMSLLKKETRDALFNVKGQPVYTKVRNSAPTRYTENSSVKNSLIADGCIIKGSVENSIIFRGVTIEEGTVVKDSILMQDTYVSENSSLSCVITDKNVFIGEKVSLSGHKTLPFFLGKGKRVF